MLKVLLKIVFSKTENLVVESFFLIVFFNQGRYLINYLWLINVYFKNSE